MTLLGCGNTVIAFKREASASELPPKEKIETFLRSASAQSPSPSPWAILSTPCLVAERHMKKMLVFPSPLFSWSMLSPCKPSLRQLRSMINIIITIRRDTTHQWTTFRPLLLVTSGLDGDILSANRSGIETRINKGVGFWLPIGIPSPFNAAPSIL